jgi:hypothetical protein
LGARRAIGDRLYRVRTASAKIECLHTKIGQEDRRQSPPWRRSPASVGARGARQPTFQTRPPGATGAPSRTATPGPAPRCGCRLFFAIPVWGVVRSAAGQMPILADPKNDRKPGKRPVVFQRCSPCFLSVVWFGRKLSKSLMPFNNCPVRAQSALPVFLGKSPCFRKKRPPQNPQRRSSASFCPRFGRNPYCETPTVLRALEQWTRRRLVHLKRLTDAGDLVRPRPRPLPKNPTASGKMSDTIWPRPHVWSRTASSA